jgi:gag-polypeptide of LTR copia-type
MCMKHETKALTVKVNMRRQMYKLKCKDNANVRMHLESLMKMHEQLAGMNVALTDDDLVTIILGSLPKSHRPLINAITMSATHAKAKLEPDQVVGTLIDEFERLTIKEHHLKRVRTPLPQQRATGNPRHAVAPPAPRRPTWNAGTVARRATCNLRVCLPLPLFLPSTCKACSSLSSMSESPSVPWITD